MRVWGTDLVLGHYCTIERAEKAGRKSLELVSQLLQWQWERCQRRERQVATGGFEGLDAGEQAWVQLFCTNVERGHTDFNTSARPDMHKESLMKKEIGLWIDRREAILVILTDGEEEIRHIPSASEKYTLYAGSSHARTPVPFAPAV